MGKPEMSGKFRTFSIVCVVCALLACGNNLAGDQYMDRADRYLKRGDLKAAEIELKNAIQQDQQNALARVMLGDLYLRTGDAVSAEIEL